jgi:hypothetical protein
MSRFESSRFVRNPHIMNVEVLKSACKILGWNFHVEGKLLIVTNALQKSNLYGEFALKLNLDSNEVTYNTYYIPDAALKVEELQNKFYELNAEYSKTSLIQEFEKKGFTYRSNIRFIPNDKEKFSFYMDAKSLDPLEDEPYASIKFTVLSDGSIVTDSDYLPNDVNENAHAAMDILEQLLGNKRVMTKKPIPARYLGKMKPRRITNVDIKNN